TLAFCQKRLAASQLIFRFFALLDVGIEPIPRRYLTFRIPRCAAARLNPSVNSIGPSIPLLNIVGLARFYRLSPCLDDSGKVVRVNDIDARPVFQFLPRLAEIFHHLLIKKLHLACCTRRMYEPRDVVNDLPPRKFAGLQSFLSTLPILDINIGSVPLEDVARFILQWIAANKEPSV